jgi:hypothetical protein
MLTPVVTFPIFLLPSPRHGPHCPASFVGALWCRPWSADSKTRGAADRCHRRIEIRVRAYRKCAPGEVRTAPLRRARTVPLCQAACLKALFTPSLIGSAVSVAILCASVASSFDCSDSVSNCLRSWAVDNSIASDGDFAERRSEA